MYYLIYGVEGETVQTITDGRWLGFADIDSAQASAVYDGYLFAAVIESDSAPVSAQVDNTDIIASWSLEGGWV